MAQVEVKIMIKISVGKGFENVFSSALFEGTESSGEPMSWGRVGVQIMWAKV